MNKEYYILLLTKQLSQELGPEEAAVLEEWLQQSPDNQRVARQVQLIWEKSERSDKVFTPDLDADFEQLRRKIRQQELPVLRATRISSRLLQVAAVLLVLIAAVWFVRNTTNADVPLQTVMVEQDEKRTVRLSDGTQVWLRKNSRLSFPTTFSASERKVTLEGEAYFEVAYDASKPFRIDIGQGGKVEVLGTRFAIRTGSQVASAEVLVRSGSVRFTPTRQEANAVLVAGEEAVFDVATATIKKTKVLSFNDLSWQLGGLEFVSTPLAQVVRDLEDYYKVKIELANPALAHCLYTAPLTNQPIRDVLESLGLTFQMRVEKVAPGQFKLLNGSCR